MKLTSHSSAQRRRGQEGSALVTVLVVFAVLVIIVSALVGLSVTSQRSTRAFKTQRTERYEGDAAIKAAVNWASTKTNVGRDPDYFKGASADDPCKYVVPAQGGQAEITVTCAADPGSGSGIPADTGKTPDQAVLLLGQRYGESAYNSPCTSSSNASNPADKTRTDRTAGEVGLRLDSARLRSSGGTIACQYPTSGMFDPTKPFQIQGAVKSNSPIVANNGKLVVLNPDRVTAGSSPLFDSQACKTFGTASIQVQAAASCDLLATTRSRANPSPGTGPADPWNPGETLFTDPAITGAKTAEWRQGTINWRGPQVSINGNAPMALSPSTSLAQCTGAQSDLVRFYPGWYSEASALNRIFNDTVGGKTCKNGLFWFGPAADAADTISAALPDPNAARQGVYLFDFRDPGTGTDGSGTACQYFTNTNYPHRWCTDRDTADGGPMVVGGWPAGWDPETHIGSTGSASTTVNLGAAQTDTDDSWWWYSDGVKDNASDASVREGTNDPSNFTKYAPAFTSWNRSLILKNFARKVTAVDPNGDVTITIGHREHRSTYLDPPTVTVTTTDRGQGVSCGSYAVPKSYDSSPSTGGNGIDQPRTDVISTNPSLSTISLSPSQRAALKECFKNAERVNNVSLKWVVTGSYLNINWTNPFGGPPNLFVDGMDIDIQVPTGGWFPPGGTTKTVYCDREAKAGVQFIFGGDSTVHAGQSGFQLCAGQAPTDPSEYQQIAVWGQPQNFLTKDSGGSQATDWEGKTKHATLVPTAVSKVDWDCGPFSSCPEMYNKERALSPGTPYTPPGTKQYVSSTWAMAWDLFGSTYLTGRFSGFGGVEPYASCDGTTDVCIDTATEKVDSVELKAAYNADCGTGLGSETDPICWGAAAVTYIIRSTSGTEYCRGSDYLPPNRTMTWYSLDVSHCFALSSGDSTVRVNDFVVDLRLNCNNCDGKDKWVSGVEVIPRISAKTSGSKVVLPATGCRLSPNGFSAGVGDASAPTLIDGGNWFQRTVSEARSRDCALISGGRVSISGTIYSPSDALEIADTDSRYPFASRGLVARHLRIRAYNTPLSPQEPSISNKLDGTPAPREALFIACIRSDSTSTSACGSASGDRVLTRARVRFGLDNAKQAKVPNIVWWSTDR